MEPDRDVVNLKLARIEDCLGRLEPYAAFSDWEFTSHYDRYREAKRILATALAAVAQTARHLQRRLEAGGDEPLLALAGLGILERRLADRLVHAVRLATTLSRAHFDEDRDIVHAFLRHDLGDLATFARAVTTWLDARERDRAG